MFLFVYERVVHFDSLFARTAEFLIQTLFGQLEAGMTLQRASGAWPWETRILLGDGYSAGRTYSMWQVLAVCDHSLNKHAAVLQPALKEKLRRFGLTRAPRPRKYAAALLGQLHVVTHVVIARSVSSCQHPLNSPF
eukprot:4925954-Pleurochrysis_carterae.AAC.1